METIKKGSKGEAVKTLQAKLNLSVDGIFGPLTEEAVKDFQKENGLTADGIVGPKTWEKLGVTEINKRNITRIIVHCSATPEGEDYTVEDIKKWHLARGFNDIGYHYVVYRDGSVHKGRSEAIAGAHTTGYNSTSIGVCYIGGCDARSNKNWANTPKDTRTPEQKESLENLLKELKSRYPKAEISGHRNWASKACPSFDAKKEYSNI